MSRYTYTFDQIILSDENAPFIFESYDRTVRAGGIDLSRYFTADYGTIEAGSPEVACELLFRRYNIDHPAGYAGRSMSVSDIVNLWDNSTEPPAKSSWYCDSIGFKLLEVTL